MNSFQFVNPTHIIFGEGTVSQVGELSAKYGKTVLLVYGSGSVKKQACTIKRLASYMKQVLRCMSFLTLNPTRA